MLRACQEVQTPFSSSSSICQAFSEHEDEDEGRGREPGAFFKQELFPWSVRRPTVIVCAMIHVGIGYDVHPLVEGRKLILGGVEIPHAKGLQGHSDADVLMHAICDAVLGAMGERDIGHFFPNTDPRWKNAPSKVFLHEAARQVGFHEGKIVNVDATIIAQEPKLASHVQAMKENVAKALSLNLARVGIKATTNEHLGFLGRGEGIAVMAVPSVALPH